uniref:Ig-like domain-containing protein n=1 Tax=Timema shepardi TaxID=629360 RepID=A0A7R9FW83_TIMSH|nr:unnamed protein product [Timema shepardi]
MSSKKGRVKDILGTDPLKDMVTSDPGCGVAHRVQYEGSSVVLVGEPILITCNMSVFYSVKWQRGGDDLNPPEYKISQEKRDNMLYSNLSVAKALPYHTGNYRCFTFDTESHHVYVISANVIKPNFDQEVGFKLLSLKAEELVLQCNFTAPSTNYTLTWLKDDLPLPKDDRIQLKPAENKLVIVKPIENDGGNYTCAFSITGKSDTTDAKEVIPVVVRQSVWLTPSTTAIEGEKLRLECSIIGKPMPNIIWRFNDNFPGDASDNIPRDALDNPPSDVSDNLPNDVSDNLPSDASDNISRDALDNPPRNETYEKSGGRVKLLPDDKKIPNAVFQIDETKMEDRGEYHCIALTNQYANSSETVTMVRVKAVEPNTTSALANYATEADKLAALWPFLGICAEVFVLCAIILIYEKKRNKTELEESDTDQSPEHSKIKSGDKICDSCRKLLSNSVNKDQSTEPPSDDTDDDSPQEINISSPEKADALACLNPSSREAETTTRCDDELDFTEIVGFVTCLYGDFWWLACVLDSFEDKQEFKLANTIVVLSSTAEDEEIEVRISDG